jgi:hypothetical protein
MKRMGEMKEGDKGLKVLRTGRKECWIETRKK